MNLRLKHGEGRRFTTRDIIGIFVICCAIFIFVFYDKNFTDAFGERKVFEKADREVRMKVVVDRQFLVLNGSAEKSASEIFLTIDGASKIFERDFGIGFAICDFAIWEDDDTIASFMKFREEFAGVPCDIVVLFSGRRIKWPGADKTTSGIAFGSRVILRAKIINKTSDLGQSKILTHEFGHLFGALLHGNNGLMSVYDAELTEESWDEFNWRVIMFHKYKNFHKYDFLPQKFRP